MNITERQGTDHWAIYGYPSPNCQGIPIWAYDGDNAHDCQPVPGGAASVNIDSNVAFATHADLYCKVDNDLKLVYQEGDYACYNPTTGSVESFYPVFY